MSATPSQDVDALWALAPAGTKLGIVMSSRAVRMTEHAWQDIHAFIKNAPELADASTKLDRKLGALGGDLSLAAYGMTADKGAAIFYVDETHSFMVIPVVDRDRFVQKAHGQRAGDVDQFGPNFTCKPIKGVYACADSAAVLASLGTATQPPHFDARGDIEMFADGYPGLFARRVTAVLQLDRGAVVARGTIEGVPSNIAAMLGPATAPVVDHTRTAGFLSATLAGVKSYVPAIPVTGGLTLATAVQSVVGPIMLTVPAGQMGVDVRIPLSDPGPATTLVANCAAFLPATVKNGTCTIPLPQEHTELSAWVEGTTLRIGVKNLPAPASVPLTPIGAELASGTWNISIWGRGTMLGAPIENLTSAFGDGEDGQVALRIASVISELGFGGRLAGDKLTYLAIMRTIWSNPDDVVATITALPTSAMLAGEGAARAHQAAGTTSPLAADLQAGAIGLMVPGFVVGGIVVPALMDSMRPRQRMETDVNFERLGDALKRVYAQTGAFPVGDTGLTPPQSCCQGPHAKCDAGPTAWATGPWQALGFELTDPALFQYSYHSDGKTAEIRAVGDLDCDGISITYRLKANAHDGQVSLDIQQPPPNTD